MIGRRFRSEHTAQRWGSKLRCRRTVLAFILRLASSAASCTLLGSGSLIIWEEPVCGYENRDSIPWARHKHTLIGYGDESTGFWASLSRLCSIREKAILGLVRRNGATLAHWMGKGTVYQSKESRDHILSERPGWEETGVLIIGIRR